MTRSVGLRNGINFLLFQGGWIVVALRHDDNAAWFGLSLVALHLAVVSRLVIRESLFLLAAAMMGIALDSLWMHAGILGFTTSFGPLIPLWLIMLWLLFLTTLWHSLAWLTRSALRWVLPPVVGPLAYFSAARLGALEAPQTLVGWLLLALGWGLLFPLQSKLATIFREYHVGSMA